MSDQPAPTIRKFNPGLLQSDEEIRSSSWSAVTSCWCSMTCGATSGPPRASTFSWSGLAGGARPCCLRESRQSCAATRTSPDRCCRSGSWKRARKSSVSPTSGWRPCSIWPTKSMSTMPTLARELRDTRAALSPRWREQITEAQARAAVLDAADRLGKQTRPHRREPAVALPGCPRRIRLAAPRGASDGTADHPAGLRHQPLPRHWTT